MDSNALYYTLSTISQTLAAGFAVLSAFVLFRLQGVEAELMKAVKAFSAFPDYFQPDEVWTILHREGIPGLERRLQKIEAEKHVVVVGFGSLGQPAEMVLIWWPVWSRTVQTLRLSLAITVLDIAACLIALPLVPVLATTQASYWLVLGVVVSAVLAVMLYAHMIWLLLKPTNLIPDAKRA
jgi:hypothetical protein